MKPQILRDLRFLFSLVVACGPAGVPGAGGPGRCVCRWAAARPSDGVAFGATGVSGAGGPGRCVCRWAVARPSDGVACGATGVPGAGGPALKGRAAVCAGGRRPAREIATREPAARSGRSRGPPWPCHRPPAPRPGPESGDSPVPSGPSGALHTGGAWSLMCYWVRCFEARPGPAPRLVPYPQFRMQFPDTCSSLLSEKPGISTITFQSMKCAWGNCMRICADRAPPPLTGTAAWPPVPPAPSTPVGPGR